MRSKNRLQIINSKGTNNRKQLLKNFDMGIQKEMDQFENYLADKISNPKNLLISRHILFKFYAIFTMTNIYSYGPGKEVGYNKK